MMDKEKNYMIAFKNEFYKVPDLIRIKSQGLYHLCRNVYVSAITSPLTKRWKKNEMKMCVALYFKRFKNLEEASINLVLFQIKARPLQ